jgi:hypothetical protein
MPARVLHPTYNGPDEPRRSRLASWPPPSLRHDIMPIPVKPVSPEPVKYARPRGWRLTRAKFSEFQGEEE